MGVQVEELYYPEVRSGDNYVQWNPTDVVKLQAQILPKTIIGTLHSHPDSEPHLSKEDIVTAQQFGEVISGVFSYWREGPTKRRRTSFDWYYGARVLRWRTD